ncbi:MAG: hypothetical protein DCC58_19195 [Chloroflexi bacterium]|nr:MAG: hypothetical protein DCC58_19195 [Chloroflexota bacterium]
MGTAQHVDAQAARLLLERHAELQELVSSRASDLGIPGVAVGVTLRGAEDIVYHGVTTPDGGDEIGPTTRFPLGSTDKTFTATLIMRLVEQGRVDISAPVRRYLPELRLRDPAVAEQVTVLHLLNHTSGWAGDFAPDTGDSDDHLARFVERLVDAEQEAPLGARVSYSNSAFSVAMRVVEKVTRLPYRHALQQILLDPLGLVEHDFATTENVPQPFALGHVREGHNLRCIGLDDVAGGIAATARDQLRYARFHLGDGSGLLRPETLAQMRARTTPDGDSAQTLAFGIGWMLRDLAGVQVIGHGGSNSGHQSALELVPERGFALVGLTNARHGLELLTDLKDWAFETYLGLAPPPPEFIVLTPDELAAYTGEYVSHTGIVHVAADEDVLVATLTLNPEMLAEAGELETTQPEPPLPFRLLADDRFLVTSGQYKGLRGAFLRDLSGEIDGIDLGRVFTRRR